MLNSLEESDVVPCEFLKHDVHESISEIESLLDLLCIDEEGGIIQPIIDDLAKRGYAVYPLERDRFGWVLGAVETKKGSITFG